MAQVFDANLVTRAMLNGSRRGELRKQQPDYLRELTVDEAWHQHLKQQGKLRPPQIVASSSMQPAGYSKYLGNRFPPNPDFRLGCQWDANATVGTDVASRYLTKFEDPRARMLPGKQHNRSSLPNLGNRHKHHYEAGKFVPDWTESVKPIPENPNHHISMRSAYGDTVMRELPLYKAEYGEKDRAGIDPTTQLIPATGWVPPYQGKDYENISERMKTVCARKVDPNIPDTGVMMKEAYWG